MSGLRVFNLREMFTGIVGEGIARCITTQICEVSKPLLSVIKAVSAGGHAALDADSSYVEAKPTKERLCVCGQGEMLFNQVMGAGSGFSSRRTPSNSEQPTRA